MKKIVLTESVWTDIQKRSSGEEERKEESLEHLDRDGMLEYITEQYDIEKFETTIPYKSENSSMKWFQIPIFKYGQYGEYHRLTAKFKDNKIYKIAIDAGVAKCKDFIDQLDEKFEVDKNDGFSPIVITGKEGNLTNRICIEIIDTIIENAEFPLMKKKEE